MDVNDLFERIPFPIKSRLPTFAGATGWLNTEPLTAADLDGRVVLVDFWTYTCINWIRTLPYLRAWAERYRSHGLVVVGVHTPEFGIEHDIERVRRAALDMDVEYPIAIDNDYEVWNAFANQYWPALYLADAEGRIQHHHFGEGGYDRTERMIQRLLADAGSADVPEGPASVDVRGIEVPADEPDLRSPETYLGFARSSGFSSPGEIVLDHPRPYEAPPRLRTNEWALAGVWTLERELARLDEPNGHITYRFHARDVNLILAPSTDDTPARFRIRLDGAAPGDAHGLDVAADGTGTIDQPRLYQLIRQSAPIDDREVDIELLDPGASALCFTFG